LISKYTIQQVQNTADVYEVINDFVPLKRKGASYTACCPFHNEKSPSFLVTPAKGIYKCFGCGASGNSISFVMDYEKMSFAEAIRYLANKYNIPIEETVVAPENKEIATEKDSLMIVLNYAKKHFVHNLFETDEGKGLAYTYFKERGFNDKTIETFELGYALNSWDDFTNLALKEQYDLKILEKAGLTVVKEEENKKYDRFRARVIFPIHNTAGKPIAFGARILTNDKSQAKYINSPETEVYVKNQVLYGIFQAKNSIRTTDNCFLVEGYTDVISLHQNGVHNVVASSGTSLTDGQIKLISRYTKNITVLYDGDAAGIKASLRGIDLILEQGLHVKVATFPSNDDPDSYIRKVGGEQFSAYIKANAKDFIAFKTQILLEDSENDPIKKAKVIHEVVESIAKIPDAIEVNVYVKQASQMLDIAEDILYMEYNKLLLNKAKHKKPLENNPTSAGFDNNLPFDGPPADLFNDDALPQQNSTDELEKEETHFIFSKEFEVLRLLLTFPLLKHNEVYLYQYVLQEIEDVTFTSPIALEIFNVFLKEMHQGNIITMSFFTNHTNEEWKKWAIDLSFDQHELSENWQAKYFVSVPAKDEDPFVGVHNAIIHLKWTHLKLLQKQNGKAIAEATTEEELLPLLKISIELKKVEKEISKSVGNILK